MEVQLRNVTKISEIIAPCFYELHRNIRDFKYTHIWLAGGRASTKSSFISIELILQMMKHPEANAVVLRKVERTLADSVFSQLIWAIEKLGVYQYWQIKKSPLELIYIPTGQQILFRGADDPKKLKSTRFRKGYCEFIWYEEVDEFFGMEEIRTINQTFMRGGDKYEIFYSYNPPKSVNSWVNGEAVEVRPDKIFHKSTYLDVPKEWLGEQFFIEAEHLKKTNELAYRNEYLGEATGTGGAVFTNVVVRKITDEEIALFDKIKDGIDFGYAIDPSVYTQNHFDKTRRKLYIFNEIYKVGLTNKRLYEEIKQIKVGNSYITCDSAEPKSIDELRSYGLRVIGAKKGADSIDYGIRWLQSLEEIVIDNERCPNTAKEFTLYEYEKDKMGNFKSQYPDSMNHCIIGSTEVYTKKGKQKIKDLLGTEGEVLAFDGDFKYCKYSNVRLTQRQARIYKLTLNNGNTIVGTYDHPILTKNGYVLLGELKENDEVIVY